MKQETFNELLITALQDPQVQEAFLATFEVVPDKDGVDWTKVDKAFEGFTDLFKDLPKGTYTTKTTRTTR